MFPYRAKASTVVNANAPIGTAVGGYARPEKGPFLCGKCIHFASPNSCNHPKIVDDPEVRGEVEAKGCCNFFRP